MNQSAEPDAIELCASVAVSFAAKVVAEDQSEDQLVRLFADHLLSLPNTRSSRDEWLDGLWKLIEPKRLPSPEELSERSTKESVLLSVCFNANAVFRNHAKDESGRRCTSDEGSRHRHLTIAAMKAGALVGLNKSWSEAEVRRALSLYALDHLHKDNREDKAHVFRWLTEYRNEYKSDEDRADAIIETKQVSAKRSTVRRWIIEWNRAEREKRTN